MANWWKILVTVFVMSAVSAKPVDFDQVPQYESDSSIVDSDSGPVSNDPDLYLIIAEMNDDNKSAPYVGKDIVGEHDDIEKRSVEKEVDDLETAAGTNVLRPLFVYRQQLAYRERVKKNAIRRLGIRPRF